MNLSELSDLQMEHGSRPGWSALFSTERPVPVYRYALERDLRPPLERAEARLNTRRLVACGLNPSTANAFTNDPTITRETGFARDWDCGVFVKVNAYAYRATKPSAMWAAAATGTDVCGRSNDAAIRMALTMLKRDGGVALACWGVHAKPSRVLELSMLAHEIGVEWLCLGHNKGGSPKHPLYVRADTGLRRWAA